MTAANAALSLLELDGLVVSRRHGHFRFELSVEKLIVRAGEPVLIRGRNGSGKSTLMDVLGLVLRPDRAARFAFRVNGSAAIDVGAQREATSRLTLGAGLLEQLRPARQVGGVCFVVQVGRQCDTAGRLSGAALLLALRAIAIAAKYRTYAEIPAPARERPQPDVGVVVE